MSQIFFFLGVNFIYYCLNQVIFFGKLVDFINSDKVYCLEVASILEDIELICESFVNIARGVNAQPNPRTQHEPDTGFCELGLSLNGFGS